MFYLEHLFPGLSVGTRRVAKTHSVNDAQLYKSIEFPKEYATRFDKCHSRLFYFVGETRGRLGQQLVSLFFRFFSVDTPEKG